MSLKSNAYAQLLDLVAEGEIEGLVNGAKSIYLNGTPLQNADNTYNFQNVTYEARNGSQTQTYISGFPSVESESAVNVKVLKDTPVVRTISNANVNSVRVTVYTPSMYNQKGDGSMVGVDIDWAVDVQTAGGGYVQRLSNLISGKTTSKYQRSVNVSLTGTGPWDIRVRRITADSAALTWQSDLYWETYTEIIDAKLRYPNSALVGLRLDAKTFSGIPTRGYDLKLKRVQIPSNYNPTTRTYSGSWNGTFSTAWTDNPAWCFYDLVTNTRYGLGEYTPASLIDKWALYTIGQYCDQLVPDGFGGTEPRFTCNLYLQSRAEAYKVINDLASCFRSMVYWAGGSMTLAQDSPSDAVGLFSQANVSGGLFTYAGSSAKARHTVALVTWNDPSDLYAQKVEYVEDADGIARYGVVNTEVLAFGCTSRGQANRVGRWILYAERNETETVSFTTGIEGSQIRPSDIIKVADANRAGVRLGGRISTATTTSVTLDAAVTLGASTWTLYAMLPNGTVGTAVVSGAVGSTLSLGSALSAAPQAGAQWILTSTSTEAQTFRVLNVVETESGEIEITALKHEPLKYAAVENGLVLEPRNISVLDDPPGPPSAGTLVEYLYATLTDVKVGVNVSWAAGSRATEYVISYSVDGAEVGETTTNTNSLEILNAKAGTYSFEIRSVSSLGVRSTPYTFVIAVLGKSAPPAAVTGLQMTIQNEVGLLQWDQHADLDVRIGGQISVRYSEALSGALWNTALPVGDFPGSATSGTVPLAAGTYLAKAKDGSGIYSNNPASVITEAANLTQFNAVASSVQEPLFAGAKSGLVVVGNRLQLEQSTLWDSITDLDAYTANLEGGLLASGEYEFDTYVDTGASYTSRVTASFSLQSFNVANLVDQWPLIDSLGAIDSGEPIFEFVDSWPDWDLVFNFDTPDSLINASLQVFISTTADNPAGSPTWSDWRTFYIGDYTARAFKFKVRLTRGDDVNNQVALSSLGVTIDVPDRVQSANNIVIPAAGLSILFANAFYSIPAVAITSENMATGDYATITSKTASGFTIQFRNSAGTGVERTIDWIAKGYGYQN